MPITPFHFGPGLLIKAFFSKWFSFRVFILTNVVIDIEPLYFILSNQWPVHGIFHTYLGATFIAISCILVGRLLCYQGTVIWNIFFKIFSIKHQVISQKALIFSAFIGTYSHIFLDSLMHKDMAPMYPLTNINPMLHAVSYGQLHLLCIAMGVVGFAVYKFGRLRRK